MKQVKQRTLLIYILLLLFLAGLATYCVRYVALGGRWASFSGNLGAFEDGLPALGQIETALFSMTPQPVLTVKTVPSAAPPSTPWAIRPATSPPPPFKTFKSSFWAMTSSPAPPAEAGGCI